MSVLFFMPWVTTTLPIQLGRITIHPYIRGEAPGALFGIDQSSIDAVMANYGDQSFQPLPAISRRIDTASIITWENDTTNLEVGEEEIQARFEETKILIFAAIANRRFCHFTDYCNTDSYQVIAQRFDNTEAGATCITTRRRDGGTQHYIGTSAAPRFIRPFHIGGHIPSNIDQSVANALFNLQTGNLKSQITAAIDSFLLANTDAPGIKEQSELTLMRVAFETLLNSSHMASDLRERLSRHFQRDLQLPAHWFAGTLNEATWRGRWPQNVSRPLDAWVQDFCAARNAVAHGPRGNGQPTVWNAKSHLLFSSWLFPLIVKKLLADEGAYQLSIRDVESRRLFEIFLAHDPLTPANENNDTTWWSRSESTIQHEVAAQEFERLLNQH
ncbi:hypothetical protein [Pseudomonas sp. 273]|uniref:hypothetical protein n=1 Tax=Pseudomonas sp. 273 TaxID=75692 RepID=UPI0023D85384|nr:hypothetical protein [Pseudomonas sp. 273]